MAPPKELREGTTTRQKIIAVVLVIILIVVVWQIISLVRGGKTTPPSPVMTPLSKRAPTTPPVLATNPSVSNLPVGNPPLGNNPPPPPPGEIPPVREAPVTMDPQTTEAQKKTDQKYVEQLNQLQLLKIQREIAETNQAIAAARLATVTSEKNVSDLLTRPPTPPPPSLPSGVTTSETANVLSVPQGPNASPVPPPPPTKPIVIPPPVEYSVVSVSMQLCRWSAVISAADKLFNVSVGDVLPLDGAIVASINKNGVVLIKNGKRKRLMITSSL